MTQRFPRACARCGKNKPPWFEYCSSCYAEVQMEMLGPNLCAEQDCANEIPDDHYLCHSHWDQSRQGIIDECLSCGEFKPSEYSLCRLCHKVLNEPATRFSDGSRPYDRHDGPDDPKTKDKMYWFHHQDNGICNYCGRRYPYDQLEVEHMIPKILGGGDTKRNVQLACRTCNRKKGTATDMEFRALNSGLIPPDPRTPPRPPIDPQRLKSG